MITRHANHPAPLGAAWATAAAALLLSAAGALAKPAYRIEPIPVGDKVVPVEANAINNQGTVVGSSRLDRQTDTQRRAHLVAFRYRGGVTQQLERNGTLTYSAQAVNERDEAVGNSLFWDRKGHQIDHPTQPEQCGTNDGTITGNDINKKGTVAVQILCYSPYVSLAGIYKDGEIVSLGTLDRDTWSEAYGINNRGQVMGFSAGTDDLIGRVFLWSPGGQGGAMRDIGTLGGQESSTWFGLINDAGHVAGMSQDTAGLWRPFLYDGGTMTALPACQGYTQPRGINNLDQVVGADFSSSKEGRAFLIQDGQCHRLSKLLDASGEGWELWRAEGINDAGQIVGTGAFNGEQRAFIATPIRQ